MQNAPPGLTSSRECRDRGPGATSRTLFPRCQTKYAACPAQKFGSPSQQMKDSLASTSWSSISRPRLGLDVPPSILPPPTDLIEYRCRLLQPIKTRLAQSRHIEPSSRCPLLEVKRTTLLARSDRLRRE